MDDEYIVGGLSLWSYSMIIQFIGWVSTRTYKVATLVIRLNACLALLNTPIQIRFLSLVTWETSRLGWALQIDNL